MKRFFRGKDTIAELLKSQNKADVIEWRLAVERLHFWTTFRDFRFVFGHFARKLEGQGLSDPICLGCSGFMAKRVSGRYKTYAFEGSCLTSEIIDMSGAAKEITMTKEDKQSVPLSEMYSSYEAFLRDKLEGSLDKGGHFFTYKALTLWRRERMIASFCPSLQPTITEFLQP